MHIPYILYILSHTTCLYVPYGRKIPMYGTPVLIYWTPDTISSTSVVMQLNVGRRMSVPVILYYIVLMHTDLSYKTKRNNEMYVKPLD